MLPWFAIWPILIPSKTCVLLYWTNKLSLHATRFLNHPYPLCVAMYSSRRRLPDLVHPEPSLVQGKSTGNLHPHMSCRPALRFRPLHPALSAPSATTNRPSRYDFQAAFPSDCGPNPAYSPRCLNWFSSTITCLPLAHNAFDLNSPPPKSKKSLKLVSGSEAISNWKIGKYGEFSRWRFSCRGESVHLSQGRVKNSSAVEKTKRKGFIHLVNPKLPKKLELGLLLLYMYV